VDRKSELPSSTEFARIEGELFERIAIRYRRQALRHRLVAVAAVLVLGAAGVAAGTTVNTSQQGRFAYCYSGPTTNSRVAQLALTYESKAGSNPVAGATKARAASALFICSAAWRGGVFNRSSSSGPFPAPKLQVCVRDDLIVSVFRKTNATESADAFCDNLGLSAP
jgi:hypothetical protein